MGWGIRGRPYRHQELLLYTAVQTGALAAHVMHDHEAQEVGDDGVPLKGSGAPSRREEFETVGKGRGRIA